MIRVACGNLIIHPHCSLMLRTKHDLVHMYIESIVRSFALFEICCEEVISRELITGMGITIYWLYCTADTVVLM